MMVSKNQSGFDILYPGSVQYSLGCTYSQMGDTVRSALKVFKALSDETRLRVLNLILERECCVCEIVQAMRISQTRASRSLSTLHDAGLLKVRRDGLWVLYSIDEEAIKRSYDGLTEIVRNSLKDNEVTTLDQERLKTAVREGPCSKWVFVD